MDETFVNKLITCNPGDTIKIIMEISPLSPPYLVFVYLHLKVTVCRMLHPTSYEIEFEPFEMNNKDYNQIDIWWCESKLGRMFYNLIRGLKDVLTARKIYDASNASAQTIRQIETDSRILAYAFEQRSMRIQRVSETITQPSGYTIYHHMFDTGDYYARKILSDLYNTHERFLERLRTKLKARLSSHD